MNPERELPMRAILIATGGRNGSAPAIDRYPDPLLPLVDRPFLQHVIEYLARQGVRRFDIVLSHRPEAIEQYFGDGTRWGCSFTYHLARDPKRPYRVLKSIDLAEDGPVLIGHADRLPSFAAADIADTTDDPIPLVTEDDSGEVAWTGWALLSPRAIAEIGPEWTEPVLAEHLLALPIDHVVDHLLDTSSFATLLASQRAVLEREFEPLFLTGREVEPGIWLSRNVSLHPTAKLTAPVYVGEDCHIGPDVQLGPHAVVGRGCILGRDCTVSRALIFPENYVSADLELDDVIVDRNRILRSVGTVTEADAFLLGSLSPGRVGHVAAGIAARLLALALLVLFAPLLLLTALFLKLTRRGPVVHRKVAVVLPEPAGTRRRTCTLWSFHPAGPDALAEGRMAPGARSLLLVFLPALVNVVRGELSFAGVAPRTPEEVDGLPPEWRALYLCCKVGLIAEAACRPGAAFTDDERYAAEAYYGAAGDWRYDARLVFGWLCRAILPAVTVRGARAV
jgi:NDP-sugar pyrophosphorylase family protein/lipopolysaccharide/colanic/teichoic acid biosynthesis glycosyltransferase